MERWRRNNIPGEQRSLGNCAKHQKALWPSRKIARRVARARHPNEVKQPYMCPFNEGLWHYGSASHSREYYRETASLPEGWPEQHERARKHEEPPSAP